LLFLLAELGIYAYTGLKTCQRVLRKAEGKQEENKKQWRNKCKEERTAEMLHRYRSK
jgi:hypothetical protein